MRDDDPEKETDKDKKRFKKDIRKLRNAIIEQKHRTLGEYLASFDRHQCKRNRAHEGGYLRTDRKMYEHELDLIWRKQAEHHSILKEDTKAQIKHILFHQRPLKFKSDRVGNCSLEKRCKRSRIARLEYQEFRYLCDINNLRYNDPDSGQEVCLTQGDREKLWEFFEANPKPNIP